MKQIKGFSNYYANELGVIISTLKYRDNKHELAQTIDKKGYLRVKMKSDNGIYKTQRVHRIIGETFIENNLNLPQINHKNGIKTDNRVNNLEWCTNLENQRHAINLGLVPIMKGERNGYSKLTEIEVKEIRLKYIPYHYTRQKLAKEYNVKASCIKDVVLRNSWKHI